MQLVRLFVTASVLHSDALGDSKTCQADYPGLSCNVDAPSVGNAQLQSKFHRQNAQPSEMLELASTSSDNVSHAHPFASFAAVSRRTLSQQNQLREAAEASHLSASKMSSSWDNSVYELNNVIGNIIDHSSSSEDKCSTELMEYKQQLIVTHESTIQISTAVQSTMSEVSIFDKECKEKNDELNEVEAVEQTKLKKCTTEKTVSKKTLETLQYDMHQMQHFVRAHIHLQPVQTQNRYPSAAPYSPGTTYSSSAPYLIQTGVSNADPHEPPSQERVDQVQSMVQQTKSIAEKVNTCMANASGKEASLLEVSDEPASESSGAVTGLAEVQGASELQGASSEAASVPYYNPAQTSPPVPPPPVHPDVDPTLEACIGKSNGDKCMFTPPGAAGLLTGACKFSDHMSVSPYMLLETDSQEVSEHESSPPILKCSIVSIQPPTECKEIVIELEHQFSVSYVSLTRIIEEYEQVVHSTVCEETVVQAYTQQSAAIQEDANKACSAVQEAIAKLDKFKFQYEASAKTEYDMQTTIQSLIKQCGSLTATETYLGDVKDTLAALGKCPGLGDVTFKLPTWAGAWVRFNQDRGQDASVIDSQMRAVCTSHFGASARPAEVGEIDSQGIEGMPLTNTADVPVLPACPNCKGDFAPGLTATGYGRICWDAGAPFTREGQRKNCGGGPRNILCVLEQGSSYSSSSSTYSSSSSTYSSSSSSSPSAPSSSYSSYSAPSSSYSAPSSSYSSSSYSAPSSSYSAPSSSYSAHSSTYSAPSSTYSSYR